MQGEEWNGCWKRAEVPTASIKKEQQRAIIYASVLPFCIISLMSADGLFIRSFLFLVVGGVNEFPFYYSFMYNKRWRSPPIWAVMLDFAGCQIFTVLPGGRFIRSQNEVVD